MEMTTEELIDSLLNEKKENAPEEKSSENVPEESAAETIAASEDIPEKKFWWRLLFFPIAAGYLEIIFHLLIYGNIDADVTYAALFGLAGGMIIALLTTPFGKAVNAVIGYLLTSVFCIYFVAQLIYYRIFSTFLALSTIKGAEDAMNFKQVLFETLGKSIPAILLLLLPLIVLILLNIFLVSFERGKGLKAPAITAALTLITCAAAVLFLNAGGKEVYSPYDLFHNKFVLDLSMNKLGVLATTGHDAKTLIFGDSISDDDMYSLNEDELGIATPDEPEMASATDTAAKENTESDAEKVPERPVYVPQVDDSVNMQSLYYSTEDENLQKLTAYFSNKKPTYTNEYTGYFKDYNVVFITAESLSKYAINKKWTPTLYKIMNEGFVFENYYNPLWYHSTIDGEYVNCLGQYPNANDWCMAKSANTYQPYALGNILSKDGYTAKAYHDFTSYYYDRTKSHPNMGYDFKALGFGLELPYNSPYSDLDTMETVYSEFINKDRFVMYFMTYSGHLPFSYGSNTISAKNRAEAEELTEGAYSAEATAYIAGQMELDKALEFLISELKAAGKLDNTVFIVTPDHYPYALSSGVLDELAGVQPGEPSIQNDKVERNRTCLGIWSSSMEDPVYVDKLCASVDILPTVLNLLGETYDSRLLAGHDVFSSSEELVIFADHSFMTDRVVYRTTTGQWERRAPGLVDDSYIPDRISEVEETLKMSKLMLDKDYYSFFYGKDDEEE